MFAPADDYRRVSRLFLRVLALIYLAAFGSLGVQIEGLAGSQGLLIALFLLYLSLFHAGQLFMNFQWDYLLLEAGFLAILLAFSATRLVIWLFHWLLFRLRFESGISKLISGDVSWADLSALRYYFET